MTSFMCVSFLLGRLASCFRTWVNSINDDDEVVEGEEETGPDPEPLTGEEEDEDEEVSGADSLGSEDLLGDFEGSEEEDEEETSALVTPSKPKLKPKSRLKPKP